MSSTAEADSYRVLTYQGFVLSVPGFGLSAVRPLDQRVPSSVTVIDGAETWFEVDIGALFGPGAPVDDLTMSMWVWPDEMIIDTTAYQQLLDLDPSVSLGPFSPAVSRIDLAAIERAGDDVAATIAGSGTVALDQFTTVLLDSLSAVEVIQPGVSYRGTTSYAALLEAQGNNVEDIARSLASGFALTVDADVDLVTEALVAVYEQASTELVVVLDDAGLLSEVRETADLSSVYGHMAEAASSVDPSIDDDLIAELHATTVFTTETVVRFDLTPASVPEPPQWREDRTQVWIEFMEANGFDL